jgi:thiol-disulfide isomerase/thioredoxin
MNAYRLGLAVLIVACVFAAPALAADLGDAAPALKVEKWIKGGPVDIKDGKNIYVVEFWATWCPPCRASIPHMTALQKKYKDKGVVMVGVSVDEAAKRKTRENVEPYVKDMGEKMEYAVALDDNDASTDKAYMDAFKFDGIPCAFIIGKDGKILWAGNSDDDAEGAVSWKAMEKALDEIIAGKYDLKAAQKADQERRELAAKRAKAVEQMQKYFELVSSSDKPEGAEKLGKEVFAGLGKDADMLNTLAWEILDNAAVKYRDLKLALEVGKAAYDACNGKNAAIVDTYARALFDNGQVKEAIEYEKKAVKLAGDDETMKAELEKTLKRYEAAEKK